MNLKKIKLFIKSFPISVAFFFFGLGVLVHDYLHALYEVGGQHEILSLQGGYFGIIILLIGFILVYYQILTNRKI